MPDGGLAAPPWRRFWSCALAGSTLPEDPRREVRDLEDDGRVNAAWLMDAVCNPSPGNREIVFETILFAGRVLSGLASDQLPDALVALRARRIYSGLVMAIEQAGIRDPRVYAALGRVAEQVAAESDPTEAIPLLQQFQGTMAVILAALRSASIGPDTAHRLLLSRAAVPIRDGRYDGRMATWFAREFLRIANEATRQPALASSAEAALASALAGPSRHDGEVVTWEGRAYALDLAGMSRQQVLDTRVRHGGEPLDTILETEVLLTELRCQSWI
jgi:hypothetical protein